MRRALTILLLLAPGLGLVIALMGSVFYLAVMQSFGLMNFAGESALSLSYWQTMLAEPRYWRALQYSTYIATTSSLLAVALASPDGLDAAGFKAMWGRIGLLDLDTPRELVDGTVDRLRIFAGYAGWGAGQLQAEVAEGSWYVVPGLVDDVFAGEVPDLRRQVLRRQPGDLAMHATRPADPELN